MLMFRHLWLIIFLVLYKFAITQVEFYGFDNTANYNSWNYETSMNPTSWSYDSPNQRINYTVNTNSIAYQTSEQFISKALVNPVGFQFIASFKLNRQISGTNSYFPLLFTPTILTAGNDLHPWRKNPPTGGTLGGQQNVGLLGVIITHNNIGLIHRADGMTNGAVASLSGYTLPINQDVWVRMERICTTTVKLEVYSDPAMTNLLAGQTYTVSNAGNSLEGLYIANSNGNGTSTIADDMLDDYKIETVTSTIPIFSALGPYCTGSNISAFPTTSLNGITGNWSPVINNQATTTYTFTPATGQCAISTTSTIIITPEVTPNFNTVSSICSGENLTPLPLISLNNITGSWSPSINNLNTTSYNFLPDPGQCAIDTSLTIAVSPTVTSPTFDTCSGTILSNLPSNSIEGIAGLWSNNANGIPNNYTFTPNPGQCASNVTVTFLNSPTSSFTATNVCEGNVVDFINNSTVTSGNIITTSWDFDDGNTSTDSDPSHLYSSVGQYNVLLITEAENQCMDSLNILVQVHPNPITDFQFNTPCEGQVVDFIDLSTISNATTNFISDWNWSFSASFPQSNLQNPSISLPNTSAITVVLTTTSNNGCENTISEIVQANPAPELSFTSSATEGCSNLCVVFENTSQIAEGNINTLAWDFGDGQVSTSPNPEICFNNEDSISKNITVQLTAISDQGCTAEYLEIDYILLYGLVVAEFKMSFSKGTTLFDNLSTNANSSQWIFDDYGFSSEYSPSFIFTEVNQTEYETCLTVTSIEGCIDSVCKQVLIEENLGYYIPNAFTPNGDGINDFFMPILASVSNNGFEFLIFDRWGTLVFETNKIDKAIWDGTYKNAPVPEDVYVWKIKGENKYDKTAFFNVSGHITVIR